ncbi:MAG: hypothetical protein V3S40_13470 [Kiloniellales bacterium]
MRPQLTVESLEAIKATESDISALADAYEQLSARLMPEATVAVAEAAMEHPEAPGNIVGFGIGEKISKGEPTGRAAVKVLVREKVDPDRLTEATMVPEAVDGIPTDIDETGEIVAYQFRAKHRPAPGGVSIFNCRVNAAGTLGCWVDDADKKSEQKYQEQVCILSNNHVIAMVNSGSPGDPIAQPGRLDGGVCPDDVIAKLLRFVAIDFSGGSNEVDAAIAQAESEKVVDSRILRAAGKLDSLNPPEVKGALNMKVQKSGRTTGWTRGGIDLLGVTVNVNYAPPGAPPRIARFDNQFRVTVPGGGAFSQAGDSGSLVTDPDNHPVGLLFAGGVGAGGLDVTFCNHIELVLTALRVTIHY